jgi:hypothetical protein
MPFPALLSTLIRRRLKVKPATHPIPINIIFFLVESFTVSGTKVAPFPYLVWEVVFPLLAQFFQGHLLAALRPHLATILRKFKELCMISRP